MSVFPYLKSENICREHHKFLLILKQLVDLLQCNWYSISEAVTSIVFFFFFLCTCNCNLLIYGLLINHKIFFKSKWKFYKTNLSKIGQKQSIASHCCLNKNIIAFCCVGIFRIADLDCFLIFYCVAFLNAITKKLSVFFLHD